MLSRTPGESICIGGQVIRETLVRVHGNRVYLGFEAPREVEIVRSELLDERSEPRK
ncbi:carbon storage regulator [Rosistilla carotiformis]|uniref:carbon storage regulator n=1 Tax=Rosistilla carotiformis TaxID=2528017 RepID=UPI0018D201D1